MDSLIIYLVNLTVLSVSFTIAFRLLISLTIPKDQTFSVKTLIFLSITVSSLFSLIPVISW